MTKELFALLCAAFVVLVALLVWLGISVAVPAIWLVAREPGAGGPVGSRSGLLDGILAGAGFGTLFSALAQVPDEAGLLPLAVNQLVAAAVPGTPLVATGGTAALDAAMAAVSITVRTVFLD